MLYDTYMYDSWSLQTNEHHWGGILQLKEHSTHLIRPSRSSRKHAEMASPSLVTRKNRPVFAIRWINTQKNMMEPAIALPMAMAPI
jgi:hypothetical protein